MWDHNWSPAEYFHSPITQEDIQLLGIVIGDSACRPVLEALAIRIAIRTWGAGRESSFSIRSDALGAVQAMANLRSKNPGVNRVAAELALDIVDKQFPPLRIPHIPGVANVFPDFLSRLLQPGATRTTFREHDSAKRVELPCRDMTWWRTIAFES